MKISESVAAGWGDFGWLRCHDHPVDVASANPAFGVYFTGVSFADVLEQHTSDALGPTKDDSTEKIPVRNLAAPGLYLGARAWLSCLLFSLWCRINALEHLALKSELPMRHKNT